MKEHFDNVVAPGVATERKKYVSPEIEVIDLDVQAPLLAQSFGSGAGINSVGRGSWDDEE